MRTLVLWAMLIGALSCATTTSRLKLPPLQTVAKVDLQRYLGTWYEIASFPQSFQKGCTGTTATYSVEEDSFYNGLLDYPHYTRPEEFRGMRVPDVLLSGHHEKIRLWRREQSLRRTLRLRPDLLKNAELDTEARSILRKIENENG